MITSISAEEGLSGMVIDLERIQESDFFDRLRGVLEDMDQGVTSKSIQKGERYTIDTHNIKARVNYGTNEAVIQTSSLPDYESKRLLAKLADEFGTSEHVDVQSIIDQMEGDSVQVGDEVRFDESEAETVSEDEFRTDIEAGNGDDVSAVITIYEDGKYEMENMKGNDESGLFDMIIAVKDINDSTLVPFIIFDDDFFPTGGTLGRIKEEIEEILMNRGLR